MTAFSGFIENYLENYKTLPKSCWEGIVLTLIESCAIGIIFFLSIFFVNELHFNIATSGIIMAFYGVGTLIGGYVSGLLSDRYSPKKIAIINLAIEVISIYLLAPLKSPPILMINCFVLGISTYGFTTSINTWMLNQCQKSSLLLTKTINISRVALNIGFALSGIIISLLSNQFEKIFYIYAIILSFALIYLILFSSKSSTMNLVISKNPPSIMKETNKKILINISFCTFLTGIMISQLSATYPIYVKEIFPQLGTTAVSVLFILDTVIIMLFQAPLVNSFSRFNHILLIGIGAFLMGIGMLILRFSFDFSLAIFSCIIWAVGEMLFVAMTQLVFYNHADKKKEGQNLGIYQSISALSKIIGPIMGGLIYYYFGGAMVCYGCAFLGFICLVICHNSKKYHYFGST